MRDAYHQQLDRIGESLVEMTRLVGSAMSRATRSLLDSDLQLAESVISADAAVDEIYRSIEEMSLELMARQAPVATDLRTVITSLRMSADLERMGDLALHVAEIGRRRYPAAAVPPPLQSTVLEMGQTAERIVTKAGSVIADRDVAAAVQLERDDDVMDGLQRKLFTIVLADTWEFGVEPAIDAALAGRFYERYADHAVSVARRVVYLVTGDYPPLPGSVAVAG